MPDQSPALSELRSPGVVRLDECAEPRKTHLATALASATLREEARRTIASVWVSGITLLGLSANVALDWWWADPVAAFVLVPFLGMGGFQDLFGPLSPDIADTL